MSLKQRRKFTREFKLQVLAEITAGKSVAQASRGHQLHPTLIGRWQKPGSRSPVSWCVNPLSGSAARGHR